MRFHYLKISISTFILLFTCQCIAQVYFPLKKGDQWKYWSPGSGPNVYAYSSIISDTMMENGKNYAMVSGFFGGFYRLENQKVFKYFNNDQENIIYDFSKKIGDTVYSSPIPSQNIILSDTGSTFIFGQTRKYWTFKSTYSLRKIIDSIGVDIIHEQPADPYGLIGAIINGKSYGEILSIRSNNNKESSFILNQNYPNPFNPKTTISYSIPRPGFVSMKVYNVLGQEITSLVSEEYHLGNYTVEWNASTFSNGLYFYRLQTNDFSETKKMVLLK